MSTPRDYTLAELAAFHPEIAGLRAERDRLAAQLTDRDAEVVSLQETCEELAAEAKAWETSERNKIAALAARLAEWERVRDQIEERRADWQGVVDERLAHAFSYPEAEGRADALSDVLALLPSEPQPAEPFEEPQFKKQWVGSYNRRGVETTFYAPAPPAEKEQT